VKRNLFLFFLALCLGLVSYYYQEKKDRSEYQQSLESEKLVDTTHLGTLVGIQTPSLLVHKGPQGFLLPRLQAPADDRLVNSFLESLGRIKVVRRLNEGEITDKTWGQFFPNLNRTILFTFEKGALTFLIGKKLSFDRTFYVAVRLGGEEKWKAAIVKNVAKGEEFYIKENAHRSDIPYRKALTLLKLKDEEFVDKRVLRSWWRSSRKIKRVAFVEGRNRDFYLTFDPWDITPSPPHFWRANREAITKLEAYLKNWVGDDLKKASLGKLENLLGKIIVSDGKEKAVFTLYSSFAGQKGYFIQSSRDPDIFSLSRQKAEVFFKSMTEFYDKRLITSQSYRYQLHFPLESKTIDVSSNAQGVLAKGVEGIDQKKLGLLSRMLKSEAEVWQSHFKAPKKEKKGVEILIGEDRFRLVIESNKISLQNDQGALFYNSKWSSKIGLELKDYRYE
jgi:hypothetical protein